MWNRKKWIESEKAKNTGKEGVSKKRQKGCGRRALAVLLAMGLSAGALCGCQKTEQGNHDGGSLGGAIPEQAKGRYVEKEEKLPKELAGWDIHQMYAGEGGLRFLVSKQENDSGTSKGASNGMTGAASNETAGAASNGTVGAASNRTVSAASNETASAVSNGTTSAASNETAGAASNGTVGAASNETQNTAQGKTILREWEKQGDGFVDVTQKWLSSLEFSCDWLEAQLLQGVDGRQYLYAAYVADGEDAYKPHLWKSAGDRAEEITPEKWAVPNEDWGSYEMIQGLAVMDDNTLLSVSYSSVDILSGEDGNILKSEPMTSFYEGHPVSDGKNVYLSAGGQIEKRSAEGGDAVLIPVPRGDGDFASGGNSSFTFSSAGVSMAVGDGGGLMLGVMKDGTLIAAGEDGIFRLPGRPTGQEGQPEREGQNGQGSRPDGEGQSGQGSQTEKEGQSGQGSQTEKEGQSGQGNQTEKEGQSGQGSQPEGKGQSGQGSQPEKEGQSGQGSQTEKEGQNGQGSQPEKEGQPGQESQPEKEGQPDKDGQAGNAGEPAAANWEKLAEGVETDFSLGNYQCTDLAVLEDGTIYALFLANGERKLNRYEYDPNAVSQVTQVLRLYAVTESPLLKQAAVLYHKAHPEVLIRIENDYPEYFYSHIDYNAVYQKLNTMLLGDEAPDILVMDGLNIDSYAAKGLLVNLEEVIKPMEEGGELLSNITGIYAKDKKRYAVPLQFKFYMAIGRDITAENMSSMEKLAEFLSKSDYSYMGPWTAAELAYQFYPYFCEEIVKDKQLDKEAVGRYLEYLKMIGDNCGILGSRPENERPFDMWKLGAEAKLAIEEVGGFMDSMFPVSMASYIKGDFTAFENSFSPSLQMGICAKSPYRDTAEDFLRFALSEELQSMELGNGFPVNRAALNKQAAEDRSEYMASVVIADDDGGYTSFDSEPFSQETARKLADICETLEKPVKEDAKISEVLAECLGGYLDGSQSKEETIQKIEAGLKMYLAE